MSSPRTPDPTSAGRPVPTADHLVTVEHLAKSFGEHVVLQDISFTVDPGSVTCVIGPSGSGKTTLLRALNALEVPDSGIVQVGDVRVDYAQVRPGPRGRLPRADRDQLARLRAQSGMVFQAHHLFPHKTALQNLVEGPVGADVGEVVADLVEGGAEAEEAADDAVCAVFEVDEHDAL